MRFLGIGHDLGAVLSGRVVFLCTGPEREQRGKAEQQQDENAAELQGSVSDNFSDGVDSLADTLKSTPGELTYNVKDQFPKFIKQSIEWVPLPYWWAFEFAIVLGFVNALYRRMS